MAENAETAKPAAAINPKDDAFFVRAQAFAEKDERYQATLFSFYTVDPLALEMLSAALPRIKSSTKNWHPIGIMTAEIEKREILRTDQYITGILDGTLQLNPDTRKIILPHAHYLILFSPCVTHDAFNDPFPAKRTIDITLGILTSLLGRMLFLDHVADQILIPADVQESHFGKRFRLPHQDDFVHFKLFDAITETFEAINSLTEDRKGKVLYCLDIFGRAVQERDQWLQFSLYWIALEVLTGTKGDGIAAKLGNTYGQKKSFAYDTLEFRSIYNQRHDLFHKGIMQPLSSRQERLLQCCFMDLLRSHLGLQCHELALNVIPGFAN